MFKKKVCDFVMGCSDVEKYYIDLNVLTFGKSKNQEMLVCEGYVMTIIQEWDVWMFKKKV